MSLLNTTLQTLVVRLRDLSGNVVQQKLHNRVFDAYEAKALVFEAISAEQQAVMKQFGGIIPPLHPVGQPLLVDSWTDLVAVHKDGNVYQLLPRIARTNDSYNVMKAICCSAGSPFSMDNRVDPVDYKLAFRAADFNDRNKFNAENQDKVPPTIFTDGLLKGPTTSALINFHPFLSNANISTIVGTEQFLRQWMVIPSEGDRHRVLKQLYSELLSKPTLLFLGTNSSPSREIVAFARSKNVFIYAKKAYHFVYQP